MRVIDPALAAHLASDATTLCHAWKLTRRDGLVLGFTDHDQDFAIGETTYLAASGFSASDWEGATGLSAPAGEVAGALSAEVISDRDIAAGKYDGAEVEFLLVNWAEPSQNFRLKVMEVGEVTRSESDFRAELRSLASRLDQTRGRIYARRCDADFGDARCGKNANAYKDNGTVLAATGTSEILATGLEEFATGYFRYGLLAFTSGANEGQSVDIENHVRSDDGARLIFWLPLATKPAVGDTFTVIAGCDKSFETCRTRFDNIKNFRGFPHMPGADFAYSYVDGETEHDGGPLYE